MSPINYETRRSQPGSGTSSSRQPEPVVGSPVAVARRRAARRARRADPGVLQRRPRSVAGGTRRGRRPDGYFVRVPNVRAGCRHPRDSALRFAGRRPRGIRCRCCFPARTRRRASAMPGSRSGDCSRRARGDRLGHRDHVVGRAHARPPDQCRAADHPRPGAAVPARRRGRDGQDHPGRHGDAAGAHRRPGRRIGVIVPDALGRSVASRIARQVLPRRLPDARTASARSDPRPQRIDEWSGFRDVDLLVVDEAHLLARTAGPTSPRTASSPRSPMQPRES